MAEAVNTPKVTVLMPVYNGEKYLREAIESILRQTFTDFEFLIINDGSTDNSASIIESFKDTRIRIIKNETNIGLVDSLNKGIALAKGDYIARMDCDDISLINRLAKQVTFLDAHPDISMVSSHIRFMNADGDETGYWDNDMKTNSWQDIEAVLPKDICIAHPTILIRKAVIQKYLYRAAQKNVEDWDLWLRMVADGKRIGKINEVLLKYRVHWDSVTMQNNTGTTSQKRSIKCKQNFLAFKLSRLKINGFFFSVFYSWIRGIARYWKLYILPNALRAWKRLTTSNPFKVYSDFIKLKKYLGTHKHNLIFFFPYTFVGGAERVHADILACLKDKNPLVFFTGFSYDDSFLKYFEENAKVFNIPHTLNYPIIGKKAAAVIADYINKQEKPKTFGSNSAFYLDLLNNLSNSVFCVDLKHTYIQSDDIEEVQLLPSVIRLDNRIFVSKVSMNNMLKLYHDNNIPKKISERLLHIMNYTPIPERLPLKDSNEPLNILYVGRVSPEKRIELILNIAKECFELNLPVKFQIVADKKKIQGINDYPFVEFKGEIPNWNKLNALYEKADILLITSTSEGFPMTIMEAMANGVVPIATGVGDIPLHVKNYETGFVTLATNPNDIVNEIVEYIKLLSNNKILREDVSSNAYQYAKANFSKDQFKNAYRSLLSF